ncbi:PREDICTED: uncharacterized protein LOC108562585 isoform X2 [Nicrophorus vespilloides]|uniref:Uncharacterized protein LOC108562585 isoform X2 n=1 Tax=Nicrophorus vespilloides TaxID=110193 RepID=A0ABM1MPI1_NICVS|nr:PREDICTED: uncharacterized protein LOC108562585 isoform X2 [Nicrophorus vespilloides]
MSKYVNAFLSKELTCIPRIIDKYIGKYYSNAVGNALTWVFVLWCLLHFVFEQYLNVLLRKMQYKTFTRKRLVQGLWYCGFYGTSFVYCLASISSVQVEADSFRKHILKDVGQIPHHVVLGLGLFGSFFFHSGIWDLIKLGPNAMSTSNFLLSLLPLLIFHTGRLEFFWGFMGLVSLYRFSFDILRSLTASGNIKKKTSKLFINSVFFIFLAIFGIIHFLLIPIFLIVPLAMSITSSTITVPLTLLLVLLIAIWVIETFNNPLYKFGYHWIYYTIGQESFADSFIEFSLFPIRDDDAYNLKILHNEIKVRQAELVSKRRPKNRGVLIQTLKCMVAIRRKLNKKSSSESSEDEESEDKRDSDEEISSSSEENSEDEDEEKRQYKEETAKALLEDRMESAPEPFEDSVEIEDKDENKKND